jgi:DNA-directed RNA polymerase specialized sigma24 family protein
MRKVIYYDEKYCINLIKSALSPNGKNDGINKCAIKKHILAKLEQIKEIYGVSHQDIYSEICFNFLRKSVITKINNKKGCPATFILHYVFNQLRNIERSCARGTFEKMHKNCDAMDNIAFHLEDLNDDGKWIPELTDYDDPESLLIAQQTLHQLQDLLGEAVLSVLLGDLTMDEYCSITGISRRPFYKRLSRSKQLFEELLGSNSA